jgi:hypothetical protein
MNTQGAAMQTRITLPKTTVYVADTGNNRVRMVTVGEGMETQLFYTLIQKKCMKKGINFIYRKITFG